ncbi:RHS repeat-associated core domain-containing protein [Flavobacterium defluvii]|uniref:RHS repeat-associated core domain-containing protein n=1 Tax=Flavobacterium defluvii TaxID=370979 RepID=A0A1M5L4Q9_9FLAO|nr:FG-GAP-like repeat-containing protein [Flavobacterium defluvii]SHG60094.1 RHS repeat-associated core domain-containing protein [Flavobacterium defluvii]
MRKFYITVLFLVFGLFGFGQSTEVGVTEGQLSVSLSGAATYTIPIAVPPGINGVVPQISLSYNSQSGNGMAGYGWNIAGLSTISRIPATKFHDDVIDAVDFNALDRFALDGQRLIVKNGTNGVYGADKTIYETESFSNIKITSFGVHPSGANYGPAYFLVEYPDGSKAYYGNSIGSRSVTDWAITYWENPQGVRISYNYSGGDNSFNNILKIISIKYGSITTATPINEIIFKYDDRKRAEQSYVGGLSIIRNTILKEINVIGNGLGFRNYVLDQETTSLNYQRLKSITEKSGDNTKSYNPTSFSYDDTNSPTPLKANVEATLGWSGINNLNTDYITGDFDNDGKTDIILYSKTIGLKNKYTLFSNITSGRLNPGQQDNVGTFENIFPAAFLSSDNKLLPQGWAVVKKTDQNCVISLHGSGSTSATTKHYEKTYNFSKTVTKASNWSYCDPKDYKGVVLENIPVDYYSGDFNGDGLTDVIAVEKSFYYDMTVCNFGNHTTEYQRPLYQGGTVHLFNLDRRLTSDQPDNIGNITMSVGNDTKIYIADFNGDGKSDIYVLESGFIKIYTLNKDNKLTLLYKNASADPGIALDKPILIGDYNGDGKIDFVIPNELNKDSWNFYIATGTGFNKINSSIGILYEYGKQTYFEVKGEDGVTRFPYSLKESTYIANDYNGDGKTDILYQQNLTAAQDGFFGKTGSPIVTKLILYENQIVTDKEVKFSAIGAPEEFAGIGRNSIPVFTNHNQVNQNLEYSVIYDNMIKSFKSPKDNREDVLLKRITNGNGIKETITYKPLKQDPYEPIYSPTALIETFPNTDIVIAPGFKIVSMLEKQRNGNVYKKQQYSYLGAVSNLEGLGFLGFRSTSKTNWYENDSQIISTISKNDISLRGVNIENYTTLGRHEPLTVSGTITSNTIIKEKDYTVTTTDNLVAIQSITLKPGVWIKSGSTFTAKINEEANKSSNTPTNYITKSRLFYDAELLSNKVFKVKNSTAKQYNGLENTSSETVTEYDTYNNPLKATTLLKEGGTTIQTTVSNMAYQNSPTASPYIVGRPMNKNQIVTVTGDVMSTEEIYEYKNNLLSQVKKKGTNTDYITEDNEYDSFGNVVKKTISATGLTPRVTSYGYDTSGRYLTLSIDVEGLSTIFLYNADGTLQSEKNPYGLTKSYEYDSWFKKTKVKDYLGNTNNFVYKRIGNETVVTSTADDGSSTQETFDDLGRKIKSGVKDISGSFSFVDYLYDIYDRNYKVSEPYFESSPKQWNEVLFDVYGRNKRSIAFTGKTTDITYSGLTTTVNDGVKTKMSTKNAIGNVISMTDTPGGTVKYIYFANGNLKESEYNGVKTTISQDGWGRKTKLVDASAGTYTYEYNAFGEKVKETTPNGTTIYILDDVGKIKQKTISGINTNSKTTYTYDSSSKLLLNSKFEDFSNGTNTIINEYIYDSYKRVSKSVETTPFAVFTKQISYDAFGRIELETSTAAAGGKSSSKTIKNVYKNGAHWQILDNTNSAVLWQVNTVNARGQLRTAQNGPITITNEYDTYGLASQFKYDKTAGSLNILTLNTVFDAKQGNLTSRTNSLFSRNESFKYDSQDRLTEFTNVKGVQEKQLYDDQGRITQNDLGTYGYTLKDKPYQNNSITVTPEALTYYTAKPTQIISYNTFKSPVQIEEPGIDKISFNYNDANSRTAMFYGGLQDDKLQRPLRKYYSADGTMEIKQNMLTGAFEFVTYIGGDGYSAPIVVNSNGTTQNYLYLQRDYQGSILSITDANGTVLEKRLFDAWGAIVSVKDGAGNVLMGLTVLDRGYTGHEHLQSVGLINMNGRIYDPKLHRFLQPDNFVQDPFNTQNYNRYGYVLNNPLKYTDYNGEKFKLTFNDIFAGIEIIGGVALTIFSSGTGVAIGAGLISAGVGHFAAAYNEFKQTGDWGAASKNSGVFFNISFKTDFGYDDSKDKPNGITQNLTVDDNYINVTKIDKNSKGLKNNIIPCVICHHTLDRGEIFQSELMESQSKFVNGALNTTFGVVGTIGAVAAIPETGGASGLALSLTIGQASIGMAQMADSFNDRPSEILHSYSTVPGLIAGQRGSKYATMIDFTSAWVTGSVGNAPILRGNTIGAWNSAKELYRGEKVMYNAVSTYSTYGTYNSGFSLLFNNKQ